MKQNALKNISLVALSFAALTQGSALAHAGNGEGHNGPDMSPVSAQSKDEHGIPVEVLEHATAVCTSLGDAKSGVKSLLQLLGERVYGVSYSTIGALYQPGMQDRNDMCFSSDGSWTGERAEERCFGTRVVGSEVRTNPGVGYDGHRVRADHRDEVPSYGLYATEIGVSGREPLLVLNSYSITHPHEVARNPEKRIFKHKRTLYDVVQDRYLVTLGGYGNEGCEHTDDSGKQQLKYCSFSSLTYFDFWHKTNLHEPLSDEDGYYSHMSEIRSEEDRLEFPAGISLPRIVASGVIKAVTYDKLNTPISSRDYAKDVRVESHGTGVVSLINATSQLETDVTVDLDAYKDCLNNQIQIGAEAAAKAAPLPGRTEFHEVRETGDPQ
jgi:hypothetical protein